MGMGVGGKRKKESVIKFKEPLHERNARKSIAEKGRES